MLLSSNAINASRFALRMLFFHVNLQRFLVLVVPVAFRALEGFAGISRHIPARATSHPGGAEDEVTFGTFFTSRPTIDVVGTGSDGGALKHVSVSGCHAVSR